MGRIARRLPRSASIGGPETASEPGEPQVGVERLQPYMLHPKRDREPRPERPAQSNEQVGERVAAILHSAEEAAEGIRRAAHAEAERARTNAQEAAKEIEHAAKERRQSLLHEARALEEWMGQAILSLRKATSRLEQLAAEAPWSAERVEALLEREDRSDEKDTKDKDHA